MAKKSVTISAEILPEQKDDLNELSERMDRSVSWIVREALKDYISKNKQ